MDIKKTVVTTDANRDPITGAPGSHPVGTATGAASGGVAGALIGAAVGGPIGAAVGGVAGAVAGGMGGHAVAEAVNPTTEHEYWRNELVRRPYYTQGADYGQYGPAYEYGWDSYTRYSTEGKSFDEVEADLQREWDKRRGESKLSWDRARQASRDAWQRVEESRRAARGR